MKTELAEKLLIKIMDWTPDQVSKERPLLQALAQLKYDDYQQFSTGTRFIESLVKWLSQFDSSEEKQIAYNFIKNQLIFVSSEQVSHLVSIAFSEKINPVLIQKTATLKKISPHYVRQIVNSEDYDAVLRKSLFIGLSDGAKIDQFRRKNALNNEQVLISYDMAESKFEDMHSELMKAGTSDDKFNTVFLIDDFTASGTSYCRKEDGKWKGKLPKFFNNKLLDKEGALNKMVSNDEGINVYILFYLATETAIRNLKNNLDEFIEENSIDNLQYEIDCLQLIPDKTKKEVLANTDFIELCKKYFDSSIIDVHWKKAKHDEPYLGYGECGLPVVLNHNTPNNSLPILWQQEDSFIGLFPRVTRHKK